MSILHLPDLHFRYEEPHKTKIINFIGWLINDSGTNNSDYTYIINGDLFQRSIPTPEEVQLVWAFFNALKVKEIILNQGNHEYNDVLKTFSIAPFVQHPLVRIISEPTIETIEGIKVTILPWFPTRMMRKWYEKPEDWLVQEDNELIFFHFPDETIPDKNKISLKSWKGKRVGADIHNTVSKSYNGVVYPTKKSENGVQNGLQVFEKVNGKVKETIIPTNHEFLTYVELDYNDEVDPNIELPFLIIQNAPSYELAKEKFKEYFIHSIELESVHTMVTGVTDKIGKVNPSDFLDTYFNDRKFNSQVEEKVKEVLNADV